MNKSFTILGKIKWEGVEFCDCEHCEGHDHQRGIKVIAEEWDGDTPAQAIKAFVLHFTRDDFITEWEWVEGPFIDEIPMDLLMRQRKAPTLFDVTIRKIKP